MHNHPRNSNEHCSPHRRRHALLQVIESRLVILVIGGVARTMWGKVDVSNGKLTSLSQADNDLL